MTLLTDYSLDDTITFSQTNLGVATVSLSNLEWSTISGLRKGYRFELDNGSGEAYILDDPQFQSLKLNVNIIKELGSLSYTSGNWILRVPRTKEVKDYLPRYVNNTLILPEYLDSLQNISIDEINDAIIRLRNIRIWNIMDEEYLSTFFKSLGMYFKSEIFDTETKRRFIKELPTFLELSGTKHYINYIGFASNVLFGLSNLWSKDYKSFIKQESIPIGEEDLYYPTNHVGLEVNANTYGVVDATYILDLFYKLSSVPLVLQSLDQTFDGEVLEINGTTEIGQIELIYTSQEQEYVVPFGIITYYTGDHLLDDSFGAISHYTGDNLLDDSFGMISYYTGDNIVVDLWEPDDASIVSNLRLWLDPSLEVFNDSGITLAVNNDLIEQWNDQTTFGKDVIQLTGSRKPTFKESILNSLPVIEFDSTRFMARGSEVNILNSTGLNDSNSFFVVFKTSGISATKRNPLFTMWDSSDSSHKLLIALTANNNFYQIFERSDAEEINSYISGFAPSVGTWYILSVILSGTGVLVRSNGVSVIPSGTVTAGNVTLNSFGVGMNVAFSGGGFEEGLNGQIADALFYDSNLSQSNYEKVEGYLAWKYGLQTSLPMSHPYYSTPPSS